MRLYKLFAIFHFKEGSFIKEMKQNTVEINYVLQLEVKKILILIEKQEKLIGLRQ